MSSRLLFENYEKMNQFKIGQTYKQFGRMCLYTGNVTITKINGNGTWNGTVKQNCICGCVEGTSVHDLGTIEVSGKFLSLNIGDETIVAAYDIDNNVFSYANYDPVKKEHPDMPKC